MQPQNPFEGKQLRCVYDKNAAKWWFSAVDICAILTDKDYDKARLYWNRLKNEQKQFNNRLIRNSYQTKMPRKDGRYTFTDVLDIREVIYMIQIIPSLSAEPYRLWLADLVAQNTGIETLLAQAGAKDAGKIETRIQSSNEPYVMHEITRTKLVMPEDES